MRRRNDGWWKAALVGGALFVVAVVGFVVVKAGRDEPEASPPAELQPLANNTRNGPPKTLLAGRGGVSPPPLAAKEKPARTETDTPPAPEPPRPPTKPARTEPDDAHPAPSPVRPRLPRAYKRPARTVAIDAAWLKARGNGPYVLDQPATAYVLQTDITTEGTAFVVGAASVFLDLNGHTVTYGDGAPPALVNGGFEDGRDRSVPGWDLSRAPAARLAPNASLLFGKQVLQLNSFNTPQQIVSAPVKLPKAGRTYTATVTPANPKSRAMLSLSVIDAATGRVLGMGKSSSAARGFSAVAHFTPLTLPSPPGGEGRVRGTTNPVRLRIDVTPKGGAVTSLDLDQATLTASGDCGIIASRSWTGDVPNFAGLSPVAQAACKAKKASSFTVVNGKVRQGRGDGYASPPFFCRSLPGLTVDGVETLATGMDTETLDATGARGAVTIRGCTFREQIDNISHRMRNFATITLNNVAGPIVVEGNKLLGSPQVGIMLAKNDPKFTVKIRDNEIRQDTVVTNGYALICSAVQNFEISGNVVKPVSGRGFSFDNYTKDLLAHGEVHGNVVESRERPNREYPTGLESVALRLRNSVDRKGPQKDLKIHDNTFIARCGPGLVRQAYGARISFVNKNGEMNDAGIELVKNTIRAVALSPDRKYRAKALVFDRVEPGINLTIKGNVLESNDVSLALGDSGGGAAGVTLVSNTLRKSAEGAKRAYTAVLAGYYTRDVRDVRLVGSRFENGATAQIDWGGTGTKEVEFGRLLEVRVTDAEGNALSGAAIRVRDGNGREVYSGVTGEDGAARDIILITVVHRQEAKQKQVRAEPRGPYQVMASHAGKSAAERVDSNSGEVLMLTVR